MIQIYPRKTAKCINKEKKKRNKPDFDPLIQLLIVITYARFQDSSYPPTERFEGCNDEPGRPPVRLSVIIFVFAQ